MKPYYATARASGAGNIHRKLVYANSVKEAEITVLAFYTQLWSDLCLPITVTAKLLSDDPKTQQEVSLVDIDPEAVLDAPSPQDQRKAALREEEPTDTCPNCRFHVELAPRERRMLEREIDVLHARLTASGVNPDSPHVPPSAKFLRRLAELRNS